ncbi:nucleoside deaminase [Viridibacterium curvum]|uniref:Nucleoside deaminase n=1 Tax=Viridibacterium curvum TaxID=1101404 RepID=A0ABP9QNE3_9RHOO
MHDDTHYMQLAIAASRQAMDEGNFPYGATLLTRDGRSHVSRNNQVTTGDCTGHAEVVLIREAAQTMGPEALKGATVYASGEPCAMCSGALFWAGVARVVYAMPTRTINRIGGAPWLDVRSIDVLGRASHATQVVGPLLEDEATAVLQEWVARQ